VCPAVKYFLNNEKEEVNLVKTRIWLKTFTIKEGRLKEYLGFHPQNSRLEL